LRPSQQPVGWRTDPRHRRGQAYSEGVRKRLGTEQPGLAGQRLGSARTLPANARGFAEPGQRPAAGTLPTVHRPSSADIQRQLAQKPAVQPKLAQSKPSTMDRQKQLAQKKRKIMPCKGSKPLATCREWRVNVAQLAVNRFNPLHSLENRPVAVRPMRGGHKHNNRCTRNAEPNFPDPMRSNRAVMLQPSGALANEAPIAGGALRAPEIFLQGVAVATVVGRAADVVDD